MKYVKADDLRRVIASIKSMYPETIFPSQGQSEQANQFACGARLACDTITNHIFGHEVDAQVNAEEAAE